MAEDYVRPPLVPIEPADPKRVQRRTRIVLLIVLAAIAVAAFLLARALISTSDGNAQAAPRSADPSAAHVAIAT